MDLVELIRRICQWCGTRFGVCYSCFRNQSYCSDGCRERARACQHREGNEKYQATQQGRQANRDRQRRWRERARSLDVTEPTSCSPASGASTLASAVTEQVDGEETGRAGTSLEGSSSGFTGGSSPAGRLRDQPLLPLPSASCAGGPASLSIRIQRDLSPGHPGSLRRAYVRAVLGRYLWLPDTPNQASRNDRRLAAMLFERGVPLLTVEAALLLGATRRALREPWLAPLRRVRGLSYFLPVVAELLENPRDPDLEYLTCLLRRLRPLADVKAARLSHQACYGRREG